MSLTTERTTVPAMCGVCSTHSGSSFYICILSFLPAPAYRVHTQVYCMYPVRRAPPPLFPARHHHRGLSTSTLSARRRRHLPAPVVHPVLLSPILPSAPLRPRRRHKRPRLLASPTALSQPPRPVRRRLLLPPRRRVATAPPWSTLGHPPSRRPPSRRASAALELVGAHLDGAAAEGGLVEELDGLGQG